MGFEPTTFITYVLKNRRSNQMSYLLLLNVSIVFILFIVYITSLYTWRQHYIYCNLLLMFYIKSVILISIYDLVRTMTGCFTPFVWDLEWRLWREREKLVNNKRTFNLIKFCLIQCRKLLCRMKHIMTYDRISGPLLIESLRHRNETQRKKHDKEYLSNCNKNEM